MRTLRNRLLVATLVLSVMLLQSPTVLLAVDQVRIWEEDLTLPTYPVGQAEKNPIFYGTRRYQGAQGRVYPYEFLDSLSDRSVPRTYRAVYLENEYVKICVIPELGGRLFSAVDKTDNYDFFYRQHVIKPALIGMLGAWISGGVEWNVPHHHRASTFMPVDYKLEQNPDGGATVWVGETELRQRLKWMVGLTLSPGRSWVEATGRIVNPTPFTTSFLYWANVSVHADSSYQVIFPPSVDWGVYHAKHEFTRWPWSDNVYNGLEGYAGGRDLSWWKSHPSPISIFAFEAGEDFMGGYNHGLGAGVLHVADHHLVPGKKLWEWGPGTEAQAWDKILTDSDGPYIEIMVGAYSDNQPDYSWIQPGEVKRFTQRWYPIRAIGGAKNANTEAAVNLSVEDGKAKLGFNVTSDRPGCRVELTRGGEKVLEQTADLSPARPFTATLDLPAGAQETELRAALYDKSGAELVSYQPVRREPSPKPGAVTPPERPEKIKTNEELLLAGQRLEQFHSAALEPDPYYEEALKRDPGDYRVNNALGLLYLKRGRFEEARKLYEAAVARVTAQYTRPRDGEALYYLGVTRGFLGDLAGAEEAFYRASWSAAWYSQSFLDIARLECRRGDFTAALEHLERAWSTNNPDIRILCLKAAVLRRLGRGGEAAALAAQAAATDCLDMLAACELALDQGESGDPLAARKEGIADQFQTRLEVACEYMNAGLDAEAVQVLAPLAPVSGKVNPLVLYYLSALQRSLGQSAAAEASLARAAQQSPDYVFPFRLETIGVLRQAIAAAPKDARAPYYLGNLLYEGQPEAAIACWESARSLDPSLAVLQRNLGLAYLNVRKDIPAATAGLEAAAKLAPRDKRIRLELDQMYEAGKMAPEKRLAILEKSHSLALASDELLSREIELMVRLGRYDRALELLRGHHFHTWEGGGEIHGVYVSACLLRGDSYLRRKDYKRALTDFQAALEYPDNLEVGRPADGGPECEVYYFIGLAHQGLGDKAKATESFEKALERKQPPSELLWAQGMAMQALGRGPEAEQAFGALREEGGKLLNPDQEAAFFAKFGHRATHEGTLAEAHYLIGLGLAGKGDIAGAKAEFSKVLELDVTHTGAAWQLARMK
ncbi:DUF5107 domain-containing protein [bacterium]|nr:DUF5107 domain-containing protein [bacterium]